MQRDGRQAHAFQTHDNPAIRAGLFLCHAVRASSISVPRLRGKRRRATYEPRQVYSTMIHSWLSISAGVGMLRRYQGDVGHDLQAIFGNLHIIGKELASFCVQFPTFYSTKGTVKSPKRHAGACEPKNPLIYIFCNVISFRAKMRIVEII